MPLDRLSLIALAPGFALVGCLQAPAPSGVIVCAAADECPQGFTCDETAHECRADGETAPVILEVVFDPPAVASGAALLIIRSDVVLADVAPVVTFADGTPALDLAFAGVDGDEARLTVIVDDDVGEGVYAVAAVDITSAAGVHGRRDIEGVTLRVDRRPPVLFGASLVGAPVDLTWADVAGDDVVSARFFADEPLDLAATRVTLGTLEGDAGSCSIDANADGAVLCALTIPSGAADGTFPPRIVAVDIAGNEASVVAADAVRVDTAAPAVIAESVRLSITNAGRPVAEASASSVIEVEFLVDEPLSAAPVVTLDGAGVPLTLERSLGQSYRYRLPPGLTLPEGDRPISALLTDRFGHAATVRLVDTVPFGVGIAACPPAPGTSCVDVDGDGHAQHDALACGDGDDDDDIDATVFPGAAEIPGDGKDNDGLGGDQPIDEAGGVFVDSEDGDDAGDGSRAAPLRTLDAALNVVGRRRFLFLAARATAYLRADPQAFVRTSVLGGLDADTDWRLGGRSVVGSPLLPDRQSLRSVFVDVDAAAGIVADEGGDVRGQPFLGLVRTATDTLQLDDVAAVRVIDSDVGSIDARFSQLRIVRSRVGTVRCQVGEVTLSRSVASGLVTSATCTITGVNSVFSGGIDAVPNERVFVTLFHSTLIRAGAAPIDIGIGFDTPQSVIAVASLLRRIDAGPVINVSTATFTLIGSDLHNGGGPLIQYAAAEQQPSVDTIDDVNACAFAGCLRAAGNVDVDPGFATVFHIGPGSALVDNAGVATLDGAPPAVAADFDGDCRYADDGADIGADEVP